MDKLSIIFANPNSEARKTELTKLARSLNINLSKAMNEKGDTDENKLAVLIFEEFKTGRQAKQQRLFLIVLGVLLFILGTLGMYAASRAIISISGHSQNMFLNEK